MRNVLKTHDHDGNTIYRWAGGTYAHGCVTKVGNHYTATVITSNGIPTSYTGYASLTYAERFAERLLVEMGYTIYVPLDTSTPAAEPAPEPAANSIDVIVTGLEVGNALQIMARSEIDHSEPCDWPGVKRAARLGRATLTFHGN